MKSVHQMVKRIQMSKLLPSRRLMVAVSTLFLILLFSVPLAGAYPSKTSGLDKEQLLQQARALINKDKTNRANMEKASLILKDLTERFPNDIHMLVYLSEAYYRMVDPDEDIGRVFPYFKKAGDCAQKALAIDPHCAQAHYWYGLFLLRKAQNSWVLKAYGLAREAIAELEKVRDSMPAYDHAGASRVLALLYYTAPGWSPFGDIDKSIALAKEATTLASGYLLNHLYLAQAYQKRGDKDLAIAQYRTMLDLPFDHTDRQSIGLREKAHKQLLALSG
jgi:tetratricopeptide (TPR) repeat protein